MKICTLALFHDKTSLAIIIHVMHHTLGLHLHSCPLKEQICKETLEQNPKYATFEQRELRLLVYVHIHENFLVYLGPEKRHLRALLSARILQFYNFRESLLNRNGLLQAE